MEMMSSMRRPVGGGGRTRMVRQLVKKRRLKGGGGQVAAAAPGLDAAVILKKIDGIVKNVLADEDEVNADVPFMEAGVDSLASVQLVTDLSKSFGVPLSPSVVFDYPTMRTIADHLAEEVGNKAGGGAPAVGGAEEWEEYEEWEDVEVPDDDYGGGYAPMQAIVASPQQEQAASVAVAPPAKKGLDIAVVLP